MRRHRHSFGYGLDPNCYFGAPNFFSIQMSVLCELQNCFVFGRFTLEIDKIWSDSRYE